MHNSRSVAVVATDIVDYTRLISNDPEATINDLEVVQDIFRSQVEAHGGYISNIAGDAILAVLDTAIGAIYAAVATQGLIEARIADQPQHRQMLMRMGVHMGDIFENQDGAVYGDAVNIAARLESLAPPGGIVVSREVRNAAGGQPGLLFDDQGEYDVKNIDRPIRVYLLAHENEPSQLVSSLKAKRRITKGNLQLISTEMVGRSDTLKRVQAMLEDVRMVTLLGMGGIGKTRLSIEMARRAAPDYPDGAWFADLAAVDDPEAVGLAIAGVFGVTQQSGKSIEQALVDALSAQRLLLILDNCEHVTEVAAKVAEALLSSCPYVKIIATSREALSISAENVWPLGPLDTKGQNSVAMDLFVARARAVVPDFEPALHFAAIRDICRKLDGIPLAIELAAARVRSLAPAQIVARLDRRFRLLTGGSRAGRARHQTLQHAIQWSYDLLSEPERLVLIRASVFAGGFTLEAAETVCSGDGIDELEVVDILDSLVRKSLITVTGVGNDVRYGMLETLRAFCAERREDVGGDQALRRAQARFYATEADKNFELWRSPQQRLAHEWLDIEINNLRNAFRWAVENGEVDIGARIASSVGDMGRFRLIEEAANWAETIVDEARRVQHPRLIILLTWSASSAWAFQRFDDAQRFGDEAISLLEDDRFEPFVWAYGDLAFVAIFRGDIDRAIALLCAGAEHQADATDRFMLAFHLFILATTGHLDAAREIADDVLGKVEAAAVPMSVAIACAGKAAALETSDEVAALAAYERGIEFAVQSGAQFIETLIAPRIAALYARSGEPVEALRGFERMLESFGDATDIASVSTWRAALIVLFAKIGFCQAAATLHGSLPASIDPSGLVPEHAVAIEQVREALGDKVFSAAVARGWAMSLREASNYAGLQVQLAIETLALRATG